MVVVVVRNCGVVWWVGSGEVVCVVYGSTKACGRTEVQIGRGDGGRQGHNEEPHRVPHDVQVARKDLRENSSASTVFLLDRTAQRLTSVGLRQPVLTCVSRVAQTVQIRSAPRQSQACVQYPHHTCSGVGGWGGSNPYQDIRSDLARPPYTRQPCSLLGKRSRRHAHATSWTRHCTSC